MEDDPCEVPLRVLSVGDVLVHILKYLDVVTICRSSYVCKRWNTIVYNSNHLWLEVCKKTMKQRLQEETLIEDQSAQGKSVRALLLEKMSFDKILDILVFDLIRSLQDAYNDSKKRKLDRHRIVTDEVLARTSLESLETITRDHSYSPESLSFQAALEPLLCCLCSANDEIKSRTINIIEYLIREPDNRMIVESQGFVPYLFDELKIAAPSTALQLAKIISQLPIETQNKHHVICDLCGRYSYTGVSYKCLICNDWDFCAICYCLSRHSRNHVQIKMASRNYSPFYTSAEMLTKKALQLEINEDSKTHLGFECGGCGLKPIHGVRYVCLNCGLTSLCQKCEAKHHRSHVFLKFRYPFKEALSPEYHQLFIEGASGVIPRKALRESTPFLPTLPATIPLHQNPLSEGMWIMYVYSTSQDYKPKPPLYFKLWRIDEEQPTGTDTNTNTVTVTDQETSVSFKMTCRNTVLEGKMNPKAILLCVADNNVGMGERQGDGYVGYLNLMDEWIVFKLKKKTEQDPDETDSLQPPRPDNDGDTSSDEY